MSASGAVLSAKGAVLSAKGAVLSAKGAVLSAKGAVLSGQRRGARSSGREKIEHRLLRSLSTGLRPEHRPAA